MKSFLVTGNDGADALSNQFCKLMLQASNQITKHQNQPPLFHWLPFLALSASLSNTSRPHSSNVLTLLLMETRTKHSSIEPSSLYLPNLKPNHLTSVPLTANSQPWPKCSCFKGKRNLNGNNPESSTHTKEWLS